MKRTLIVLTAVFTVLFCNAQSYNFDQGVKAYNDGDIEKALDYFGREINDNPKASLALYYRAIIYNYQEQNSFALRDINNSIKNFSSKEKIMLAGAHRLRGDIYFKIENYDKTLDDYAVAIKLSPEDPEIFIDRAQIYFDLKQYSNAEKDYMQALEMDESLILPYAGLGRNYINQKKYSAAEKVLNQLIKLAPDYSGGYKFRARLFYEQKKFDEAIDDIFNGLQLDETNQGMQNLFLTYSEKNYPLSFSKINAQISLHPEKELWYFIRAQVFEEKGDYAEAINDYSKVIEINAIEDISNLLYYRAKCYSSAGMFEQSIDDYTAAISIDSTDAYYFAYRGDAKRLMGNYKGAIEDFTKAIVIEPRESWFYYRRGWTNEFAKEYETALQDYNEAISINRKYVYTYLNRGRLYESKLQNPILAKDDYLNVLFLDTIVKEGGNCRQYALFHLGRNDEAIQWTDKFIAEYPTHENYYDATCLYSLMNKPTQALANMKIAFQKGYRDFVHLSVDADLDNIRNMAEFVNLVTIWKNDYNKSTKQNIIEMKSSTTDVNQTVTIPMYVRGGGTYEVTCKINELKLKLIFDTGASDITISKTEAEFMLKNDYLSKNDITGTSSYLIANGNIEVGTTIVFRTVDFGGLILKNVKATVIENKSAPLLFGQSALSKYGTIIIDNVNKNITITTRNSN